MKEVKKVSKYNYITLNWMLKWKSLFPFILFPLKGIEESDGTERTMGKETREKIFDEQ